MGDRSRCDARLFVSSMRLTPAGLTRYFVPDKILLIKPHGQTVTVYNLSILLWLIEISIETINFTSAFVQYAG